MSPQTSLRTALRRAEHTDTDSLVRLVSAFHAEVGIFSEEAEIRSALSPLIAGSPYGDVFLIGPRVSPVGYIATVYSWSIKLGGLDAFVDEFYLRPAVRGRGIGTDTLHELARYLDTKGVRALHIEVDLENASALAA